MSDAGNIKKCCTERKTSVKLRIARWVEEPVHRVMTEVLAHCRKSLLHPISGILLPQQCWRASLWSHAPCCVRGWSGLQRPFFVELNSDLDCKRYRLESQAPSNESQIAVWPWAVAATGTCWAALWFPAWCKGSDALVYSGCETMWESVTESVSDLNAELGGASLTDSWPCKTDCHKCVWSVGCSVPLFLQCLQHCHPDKPQ